MNNSVFKMIITFNYTVESGTIWKVEPTNVSAFFFLDNKLWLNLYSISNLRKWENTYEHFSLSC